MRFSVIPLFLALALVCGCTVQSITDSGQNNVASSTTLYNVVCTPPKIKVGNECCFDLNHNGVCDKFEAKPSPGDETEDTEPESPSPTLKPSSGEDNTFSATPTTLQSGATTTIPKTEFTLPPSQTTLPTTDTTLQGIENNTLPESTSTTIPESANASTTTLPFTSTSIPQGTSTTTLTAPTSTIQYTTSNTSTTTLQNAPTTTLHGFLSTSTTIYTTSSTIPYTSTTIHVAINATSSTTTTLYEFKYCPEIMPLTKNACYIGTCGKGYVCTYSGDGNAKTYCSCVLITQTTTTLSSKACGDSQPYCNGICPAGSVCALLFKTVTLPGTNITTSGTGNCECFHTTTTLKTPTTTITTSSSTTTTLRTYSTTTIKSSTTTTLRHSSTTTLSRRWGLNFSRIEIPDVTS
ncbi:MAG: hypothetical protein NTU61_01840 [Candidatus Altiarchaeota archaeon]|nr:hypothetical protein [Candidatus Altiarchaeota archaeon]